jgi:hypothetical protein
LEFSTWRETLRGFAVREPLVDFAAGSALAIFAADLVFAILVDRATFAPPFIFATHSTLPLPHAARLQRV